MSDLTEEELRRRNEFSQRQPRESGDDARKQEIAKLREEIEALKTLNRSSYGTGGIRVSGHVISGEEQRRGGGPVASIPVTFWQGGVLVLRRVLINSGPTTSIL